MINKNNTDKKVAFTLAEVLITIAIVGVVAVLVLPNLFQRYQEHELLNKFKTNYSLLQQTYYAIQADYGDFNNWNSADGIYEMFSSKLKVAQTCYKTDGCFPNVYYKTFNPEDVSCSKKINLYARKVPKIRLMNGASIAFINSTHVELDINGDKKPNRIGYDLFLLGFNDLYPGKIVGGGDHSWMKNSGYMFCSMSTYNCNGWASGLSCGWWVTKYINFDHIHKSTMTSAEWKKMFK